MVIRDGGKQNGLQLLTLRGTPVSDADLADLEEFNILFSIDLSRTRITDAGLKNLARARGLHHVDLRGTPTTLEAAREFRKKVDCTFVYGRDGTLFNRPPRTGTGHAM